MDVLFVPKIVFVSKNRVTLYQIN